MDQIVEEGASVDLVLRSSSSCITERCGHCKKLASEYKKFRANFQKTKNIFIGKVFDEADTLLGRFEKEIEAILKYTSNVNNKQRKYLFSSTMSKKVDRFKRFLYDPVQINSTINELKQEFILVPAKDKECYLLHILEVMSCSAMIFTSTCEGAVVLSLVLENLGLRAISIHDQMCRAQRLKTLYQFTSGVCRIIVCTDTASRHYTRTVVDMVVNYDIPPISEDYIHRVGRAAKNGDSGRAISLVSKNEVDWYTDIEHFNWQEASCIPS